MILTRKGDLLALVWSQNASADHYQAVCNGDQAWLEPQNLRTGCSGAYVGEALQDLGLQRAQIGVRGLERFGPSYPDGLLPYSMFKTITESATDATFKPVWKAFAERRLVNSSEELDALGWSARAGEKMCEAILAIAAEGVSDAELHATLTSACCRAGGNTFWTILATGTGTIGWRPPAWTYRPHRPRVVRNGDLVMCELFVTDGMLESQQQLTIAIGDVHPDVETCAVVARQAYEIGITMLTPGTRLGDMVEATDKPIHDAGGWNLTLHIHTVNPLEVFGRCGWVTRELPGIADDDKVEGLKTVYPDLVLGAGMCFAFEPNCALGTRPVNVSGTVALSSEGPIEYNTLPNTLQRVPA